MNFLVRAIILSALDCFIVASAVVLAYFLRFDFQIPALIANSIPTVLALQMLICWAAFYIFKIYHRVWQYVSVDELVALILATTVAQVSFFTIHHAIHYYHPSFIVPRSIYFLAWAFIILGIGGSRFAWRIFRDTYIRQEPHHVPSLIIGAGNAGAMLAKELRHSPNSDLYPIGFIDDDYSKWRLEIQGLPVFGGRDKIAEVVRRRGVKKIIVAIPSAPKAEVAEIIDICKTTDAAIKLLPRIADLVTKKISINMIREVDVEDLLGRDAVQIDVEEIAQYVTDKVVLITGAGGSIGSELTRQLCPLRPAKLLLLGHGENSIYEIEMELRNAYSDLPIVALIADVQDKVRLQEIFGQYRPNVVFHAAAHKHVPLMEKNPAEAVKNNVMGTKNVADVAHKYEVSYFVMISTDKAVNPTNVMGATKRVAEMYIQSMARISPTKFAVVRFGNVLGSRGSVVPLFKRQIKNGGPVTVTHPEMTRFFMTIPEAVQLVIQAGAFAKGGEVFILDMGKPVKIADLATDLIRLSGFKPHEDIKIIYTGIRPGEKLYEEILTNEEGISSTKHNRIFIGKPQNIAWEEFQFMLRQLMKCAMDSECQNRTREVKDLLKSITGTYREQQPVDVTKAQEEVAVTLRNS